MPTTKFLVRVPDDVLHVARVAAGARAQTVTAWIIQAMRLAALRQANAPGGAPVAAALDAMAAATPRPSSAQPRSL